MQQQYKLRPVKIWSNQNEDKNIIQMLVDVLQKMVSDTTLDPNSNPSGKLFQLISSINTNFEFLEKTTTKWVLDRFKEVHMETF